MTISRFPVEAGHILTFCESIGDTNPVFRDSAVAEAAGLPQIPAPPTFVQAGVHFDPDYPMRPREGERWFGSGAGPGFDDPRHGVNLLHAEQHFTYRRPLLAGDVLTARSTPGARWQKTGRRGGTLDFFETLVEYVDEAGEVVVTGRVVGVSTSGGDDRR